MSGRIIGNSLPGKYEFDSRTSLWYWIMDHVHQTYTVACTSREIYHLDRLSRAITRVIRRTRAWHPHGIFTNRHKWVSLGLIHHAVSCWDNEPLPHVHRFLRSPTHPLRVWHLQSVQRSSGVFAEVRNAGVAASLALVSAERSMQTRSSRSLHHNLQEVWFLASNCLKKEHRTADCRIMASQIVLRIEMSIDSDTLYKHVKS